jgi:hypothetical protein
MFPVAAAIYSKPYSLPISFSIASDALALPLPSSAAAAAAALKRRLEELVQVRAGSDVCHAVCDVWRVTCDV